MSPLVRHAPLGGSWRVVVPLFAALLSALVLATLFSPSTALAGFERSRLEHPLLLTELPGLPTARDGAAAVSTDDALYVVGGASSQGATGRVDRYSFASGKWEVLTTELLPRRHHAAVLVDDRLYILGGRGESGPVADVEVLDLGTMKVSYAAPMPTPRYFAGAALHRGRIVVAGGTLGWGRLDVVEMYDLAANEWYLAPPLGEKRDTQLIEAGGALYALGGYTGGKVPVSTLVERLEGKRWVKVSEMPLPTSSFSAATAGGLIFTFGDHRDPDRVLRFDPKTTRWTELETGFFPRRHSAAASSGSRMVIVGGSPRGNAHKLGIAEVFQLSPGDTGAL